MAARPVVIDCDPGIDDAVALWLALAAPDVLDVRAVTAVAGNLQVEIAARNARRVLEFANRPDVPVHAGCDRPLLGPLREASRIHGADGLGGAGLPAPVRPVERTHAVDALAAMNADDAAPHRPLTVCAIAPLTNLALALRRDPALAGRLERIVLMGGSGGGGNATAAAEYNVWCDPHAAAMVFGSGVPIIMAGLELTRQAMVTAARLERIAALPAPLGPLLAAMLRGYGARRRSSPGEDAPGGLMHDACAIGWLLAPALFAGRPATVTVETRSVLGIGRTRVDFDRPGPVTVLETLDAEGFFALLLDRLQALAARIAGAPVPAGFMNCHRGTPSCSR